VLKSSDYETDLAGRIRRHSGYCRELALFSGRKVQRPAVPASPVNTTTISGQTGETISPERYFLVEIIAVPDPGADMLQSQHPAVKLFQRYSN
jgi:hypothetical protein